MKVRVKILFSMILAAVLTLGATIPSYAGAVGGPKIARTSVNAGATDVFSVRFYGNRLARVTVSGDGDTDLDLYVYDENGNLIAKDDDYTDQCIVEWTPRWTGQFTIKVVNRGRVYNEYVIRTN